ncbi:MAG: sulfate permease [Pseudomonadota bacterium]
MKKLYVRKSDDLVAEIVLEPGRLSVGRSPDSDVCLDDSQVSWRHATLDIGERSCIVLDAGSTNGTFVNQQRIETRDLAGDDVIQIGPFRITVDLPRRRPSAASASEETLFLRPGEHPHRINPDHDPYATVVPARVRQSRARDADDAKDGSPTVRTKRPPRDPFLGWLRAYQRVDLRRDLVAGVTIAALLIPQSMAYALLAGLPPVMGLYASMLPLIVYALAGSSRQTSVGPVALDAILIAVGLSTLAEGGTDAYIALAITLATAIGVIQVVMGICRLGFLVNFLSYPVLSGLTAAAAVIIAVSQLRHILGIPAPPDQALATTLQHVWQHIGEANGLALAVGLIGTVALFAQRRWLANWPGALVVLVASTAIVGLMNLDQRGLATVGEVSGGLPSLTWPSPDWQDVRDVLPLALTMALVGFAQTIAVGKSLGNKHGYDIDANQELSALGLSNLSSAFSQGFTVSASFSRSAANAEAGAKTPLAGVVTAAVVAIAVLFLTPLVANLPNAALASIVVVSAVGLIDFRVIRYLFRVKQTEGLLLAFTFVATLVFGITAGLLAGIVASILLFVSLNTRPNAALLGRLPGTNIFRNTENFPEAESIPGLAILRIDASFYFANTEFVKKKLREVSRSQAFLLKALILDASAVNDLDSSADNALHQIAAELKKQDVDVYIAGVKAPVREVMKRSGLYDELGGDHFFFTIDAAVKRFLDR